MKAFLLIFTLISFAFSTTAQISGKLRDDKNEPVAFALIAVFHQNDTSNAVVSGISDVDGNFSLPSGKIKESFILVITSFGMKDVVLQNLQLNNGALTLGNINMTLAGSELNEFEIKTERDVVQLGIDKRVFNVEKQAISTGGSALDVLAGVPGVSVDSDGNISMRGSSNITFLINGKPSALLGSGRRGQLDKIPASQVQSIEIISNPSAKYDPDGTGGIINIILKKSEDKGTNGRIAINGGTAFNHGISAQINHKSKKGLYNLSYDYRYEDRFMRSRIFRVFSPGDTLFSTAQKRYGTMWNYSHVLRGTAEWDLTPKDNFGVSFNLLGNPRYRDMELNFWDYDINNQITERYDRFEYEKEKRNTYDATLFYSKKFNNKGHEISSSTTWSGAYEIDSNAVFQNNLDAFDNLILANARNTKTINPESFWVSTSQVDYILPIEKINGKFEAGGKAIIRRLDTENRVSEFDTLNDSYLNLQQYTNHFTFNENIFSLYGQLAGKKNKWKYQAGIRLEQALNKIDVLTLDSTYRNDYFSFFPSAFLNYDLSKNKVMSIGYSRRINRPEASMLTPFIDINDLTTQRVGNPYLNPEYINSMELGYNQFNDKGGINIIAFYRQTNNAHQRIVQAIGENIVQVRFENIARNESFGLEGNFNYNPFNWWKLNLSGSLFYFKTDGTNIDPNLVNNAGAWTGKVISNLLFWKGTDFQTFVNYRSNTVTVQGRSVGTLTIDLALRKSLKNEQFVVALRMSDITAMQRFAYFAETPEFYANVLFARQNRIFIAELTWNFGKQFKSALKKKPEEGGRPGGGGEGM